MTVATQQAAPTTATELRTGTPIEPGAERTLTERLVIHADGSGTAPISNPATTTESTPDPTTETSERPRLDIVAINADADGDDAENLNGEYVTIENMGSSSLDLTGWELADAADHTYTIPEGTVLDAGAQITVHTGSGTNTETDLYWGQSSPVWNNNGDTVILRDDTGATVIKETY
ncbi:lamin tail domain-containing protein [Halobellus inordinatus]|uniref:lamin tail domain-containing protein n=1 Tax=Halobellus inordinatus TaxID=1126236 RepID=UPI0021141574|nr:lamin tail domain-containing protein [Halobellus ramosii]